MGVLPLQFQPGDTVDSLGLTGEEVYDIEGVPEAYAAGFKPRQALHVRATRADGKFVTFQAIARIDTPQELQYYQHGGILQYVLRQLLATAEAPTKPTVPTGAAKV